VLLAEQALGTELFSDLSNNGAAKFLDTSTCGLAWPDLRPHWIFRSVRQV
jgi:hypothetical protein